MRKVHKLTAPIAFAAMASVMVFEGSRPPRLPKPQVKRPLAAVQARDAAGSGRPAGRAIDRTDARALAMRY
ncbi:MAG: hypothetical protein ACOY45_14540 [Pseudomonadota bacterium]